MIAYFDTSALAMLVLLDPGWERLAAWIEDGNVATIHSDFGWGELVAAIGLRWRRGDLTRSEADAILAQASRYTAAWGRLECQPADLAAATALVARFGLKLHLPDAIHVALAARVGCTLVTADRRQATAAMAADVSVFDPLQELR